MSKEDPSNGELNAFVAENGGYWDGEFKAAPMDTWRHEVANNDTRLGYWEWAWRFREEEPTD